jgi:uroporphyrinogen decarboxylase
MNRKLPQHRWMSLWRHFFDNERTVEELTDSMIRWQEKWKWDFLKLNPPACYHVLDWGAEYEFFDDAVREPELQKPVVLRAKDIDQISILDSRHGKLGEQLQVIQNLRRHFGEDLPIVQTIFSPIEIAHRLMKGRKEFQQLRKTEPEQIHCLLETIQKTFLDFAVRSIEVGADGIFFATKWSTVDWMTWEEYEEFGRAHEIPILTPLQELNALLILHVCGERTYLGRMLNYPVDIFSYDFFAEGVPSPDFIVEQTGKFVLGGIDPDKLAKDWRSVVEDCKKLSAIDRWLIGPSCVITHEVSDESITNLVREIR